MVGIDGACDTGVGSVDCAAGVFWGVGAAARSSTRLFLINCFSDMMTDAQRTVVQGRRRRRISSVQLDDTRVQTVEVATIADSALASNLKGTEKVLGRIFLRGGPTNL
jgi:hypothetical protein